MLTTPLHGLPATMTTTANLPVPPYPGKQPYYHHPLAIVPPALPSPYMYSGGCGGGSMTLAHPPTMSVNGYCSATGDPPSLSLTYTELNGHGTEDLISPKPPHNQALESHLNSSPPPPPLEDTPLHRPRIGSADEGSLSPNPTSSPTILLSPNSISQLPPATTSVLGSPQQLPFQYKPTFNVSTATNGLPGNGFPRIGATQHHFPQTTFSHMPSALNGFTPPYTGFAAPANHHTTMPNVVMYQPHPQQLDYNPSVAAMPFWNPNYPNNIHTPKLSYDTPRYKLTPERATPLQKWFDEHRDHPYPTRQDKVVLCQDTNLTFTQVSTWFANCRRRMKKASQEDEERQSCNGGTTRSPSSSLHNGSTGGGHTYPGETTPTGHAHRPSTRSPKADSPCSNGRHDTEENLHDYGEVPGLHKEFSITYSRKPETPSRQH